MEDSKDIAISLQAAIEIVDFVCGGELIGTAKIIAKRLSDLPPAQPEHNPADERKIADLHKMVNYLLSQLERRWIPVTERLPEKHERTITLYDNGKISGGEYIGDRTWNVDYGDSDKKVKIVAWMPRPAPYRKGDADERL